MSLVIPPGYAQASIELRATGDPQPWYITHGVDLTNVGGDYAMAANLIASAFMDTIGGGLATTTRCSGVRLIVGQDGGDNLIVFEGFDIPGGSSAAKLPQNCALLIDKTTGVGGRKGRGRFFVPNVLTEGSVDNVGVIQGAVVTDLQSYANLWLDVLNSDDPAPAVPMVLLHNRYTPQPPPTPVTGLSVQSVISTQRRRLR